MPSDPNELTGLKKSAILVLSLEQTIASEIFRHLDSAQIEEISREIASMGPVSQQTRDAVVEEFYQPAPGAVVCG